MEIEDEWEVNALLRDGDTLVPCNIQDADAESEEREFVRYVWALPLDELSHKPKTSLLGELHVNEIDSETNLPIVDWCEWQPCLCDELGNFVHGHFCFAHDESDSETDRTSVDQDEELSYPLMIDAEDHSGVMLGEWDGKRRDHDTGLPLVHLFTFPVRPHAS